MSWWQWKSNYESTSTTKPTTQSESIPSPASYPLSKKKKLKGTTTQIQPPQRTSNINLEQNKSLIRDIQVMQSQLLQLTREFPLMKRKIDEGESKIKTLTEEMENISQLKKVKRDNNQPQISVQVQEQFAAKEVQGLRVQLEKKDEALLAAESLLHKLHEEIRQLRQENDCFRNTHVSKSRPEQKLAEFPNPGSTGSISESQLKGSFPPFASPLASSKHMDVHNEPKQDNKQDYAISLDENWLDQQTPVKIPEEILCKTIAEEILYKKSKLVQKWTSPLTNEQVQQLDDAMKLAESDNQAIVVVGRITIYGRSYKSLMPGKVSVLDTGWMKTALTGDTHAMDF